MSVAQPEIAVAGPLDYAVDDDAPASPPSLRSLALRGSFWTMLAYLVANVVRLGSNLILTRLLFPSAFGLMLVVNTLATGLQMLSDLGIGLAVVQSKRGDDPSFQDTAWTVQVVRGGLLWLGSVALAWPAAWFYGQPDLVWLIPIVGFGSLIAGFTSMSVFVANRRLAMGRLCAVDLMSQVAGVVSMVALAWLTRSIWALPVGGLVAVTVRVVLSHTFLPGIRHRLRWDRSDVSELVGFGRWILLATMLAFLGDRVDALIFGKTIPFDQLGVYNIAVMMATMPAIALVKVGDQVLFAAYSHLNRQGGDLGPALTRARLPLMTLAGVAMTVLVACGPAVIRLLYDSRYDNAGWMLQVLGVMVWFSVLQTVNGSVLMARASGRWLVFCNVAKVIGLAAFIPLGFALGGFPGALIGLAAAEVARYAVSMIGVGWRNVLWFDAGLTALLAASAAAGVVCGWKLHATGAGDPWIILCGLAIAAALWGLPGLASLRIVRGRA